MDSEHKLYSLFWIVAASVIMTLIGVVGVAHVKENARNVDLQKTLLQNCSQIKVEQGNSSTSKFYACVDHEK